MQITLTPVATVKNSRSGAIDDEWANIISDIELADHIPAEAFDNITQFSHLEIIYYFDQVHAKDIIHSGHPRGNTAYPRMGIFAQRKKERPNGIGLCTVELLAHKNKIITVKYLDAINGTPVLDIKPVFKEFGPQTAIIQPVWVHDLMKNYWREQP